MPRNNRVKKAVKPYNLRLDPNDYDEVQEIATTEGIAMNTIIQTAVSRFLADVKKKGIVQTEEISSTKQIEALKIVKDLPLKERQAFMAKLFKDLASDD